MSRAQSTQTYNTASNQEKTANTNEQNSYTQAQQDAGDYQKALSAYAAGNPYGEGGQAQTVMNRQLANTSDAAAQAAGQAMQGQAVRTGTNAGGAIAGTEASEQANERGLGADEARATANRIGDQANYNAGALQATAVPVSQQTQLAAQQGGQAQGDLGAANAASAANQSFMDQFGGTFAKGLGEVAASEIGS